MAQVKALVIAGGGGGGSSAGPTILGEAGGGGGGGGYQYDPLHLVHSGAYSITVGSGGTGAVQNSGVNGSNGGDSIFDTITATGGGGGGSVVPGLTQNGNPGGSGGGGSSSLPGQSTVGGTGSQGQNGGSVASTGVSGLSSAGGGGGASQNGANVAFNTGNSGGKGGDGISNSISGSAVTYSGGGGGASYSGTGGAGGDGGGGKGAQCSVGENGTNGTANTGGGGGGGNTGGNGGSGIVIISYANDGSDQIDPALTTGGTITVVGGQRIHTFTTSGTFTVFLLPVTLSVNETVSVSENFSTIAVKNINVNDSVSTAEQVEFSFVNFISTYTDLAISLVTSAYKWLTQTLFNTQQGQTVRPYFTAQIIDDLIQPNRELFNGNTTPLGNGSMAVAPDGKAFAVGVDGAGNLNVYRASNLDAVAGVWPNYTTLVTTGENFFDARNIYSIKISDYLNGSYRICVWYFGNFINDGSNLTIKMQYSDDGGMTWTRVSFAPTSIPNNAIENLSLASMKPVFTTDGVMKMGVFYIKKNTASFASGFTGYDIYYIYGDTSGGYVTDIMWGKQANSGDWTIHSVGSYYLNGQHYCVFSGFRNILDSVGVNPNYSLWTTAILNLTSLASTDLWSSPLAILPVGSASATNKNQFLFPWADVFNGMVYITAQAVLVDSISQTSQGDNSSHAQVVITHTNYILINSDDGEGFSYPTIFVGSDGSEFNSGGIASFIFQNGFWWLGGALGFLWEMTQNNIVADVSDDVVSFKISDVAGQPSSISIQIGNADNKWVGASPTGPGAAAVAKNRKIALWQGYYNADGTKELVPHSTYFIDDITQTVTGIQNDVTIVGRDFYKKLKTTITKFSYQYTGPIFFTDIFDGTFTSSWNQVAGVWQFVPGSPPILFLLSSTGEGKIMLANNNDNSYGHFMKAYFLNVNFGHAYFYGFYIDDDNYLRLELDLATGNTWAVVLRVNGSNTTLDSGSMPFTLGGAGTAFYGVYIRRYDYFKWNFMIESAVDGIGNSLNNFDPATLSYLFKGSGNGEFDLSSYFKNNDSLQKPFTVGLGSSSAGTSVREFRFFSFTTFNNQNNLGIVMRRIARIAGIFAFKLKYTWRELLFTPSFTGTSTVVNRILNVTAGNQSIANNNSMGNGEISFVAKCIIGNPASAMGFRFVFRYGDSGRNTYYFHVIQTSAGAVICRFERLFNGTIYNFYNTPYDVSNNPATLGALNVDLSQENTFRIVMIDGWFHAFINGIMVASWNDNNTTSDYLTTGQWGFKVDTNTTLKVKNILAPAFWKPVQAFSYNPGDDAESAIEHLITSLRAWFFSDLLSRFKAIFLDPSDPSTYDYETQLFQQNVDESDKEYVSQVTVYGDGVIATSRNTDLMPGVQVREEVIVDYSITTQQDAQTRADNEITNSNQYRNQYTPKQVINVGAELFDAVTIVNTGNNTSGVDEITRVYAQKFTEGGGNNNSDYSIELETGNL